ncbi:tryptophan synthase beta subunit-like PLP-dependent enzyme [Paraphysoderma sedebokerense]|nr:tryptophan synthase beta subunit-like PLP-dependent enzyme [Paraphysoderma sedebokerense]
MSKVPTSLKQRIGNTPLLRLKTEDKDNEVYLKCEFMNPFGSIKDRTAKVILDDLQSRNVLVPTTTLIIPGTGLLAISLCQLLRNEGIIVKMIALIPEKISDDKINLLKTFNVEIIRTPSTSLPESPESHFAIANRLIKDYGSNGVLIDEYSNLSFSKASEDIAQEIFDELSSYGINEIDSIYVPVESGVTIAGISKYIKKKGIKSKILAVESEGSNLFSYLNKEKSHNAVGRVNRFVSKVEAIGNNFATNQLVCNDIHPDHICTISDQQSFFCARHLILKHGLSVGPECGSIYSALEQRIQSFSGDSQLASRPHRSLLIFPTSSTYYHSTLLSESYLLEHNLLDPVSTSSLTHKLHRYKNSAIEDLQLPSPVTIFEKDLISVAFEIMESREFDQLPVVNENHKFTGFISLGLLRGWLNKFGNDQTQISKFLGDPVKNWMYKFGGNGKAPNNENIQGGLKKGKNRKFVKLTPETSLLDLSHFFEKYSVGFVTDENQKWCLGVVTKYDLLKFLEKRMGV